MTTGDRFRPWQGLVTVWSAGLAETKWVTLVSTGSRIASSSQSGKERPSLPIEGQFKKLIFDIFQVSRIQTRQTGSSQERHGVGVLACCRDDTRLDRDSRRPQRQVPQ